LSRRMLEYENAIDWNTTCLSCPAVLDSAAAEMFRREAAEAKLTAVAEYVRSRPSWVVDPVESRLRKDSILAIIGGEGADRG
jgi:hypothetical protein